MPNESSSLPNRHFAINSLESESDNEDREWLGGELKTKEYFKRANNSSFGPVGNDWKRRKILFWKMIKK